MTQRTDWWLPREGVERAGVSALRLADAKPIYREWIDNKVLRYRTGNYIQHPGTNYNGKTYEKEYMYN